jgi:hypothetical protein
MVLELLNTLEVHSWKPYKRKKLNHQNEEHNLKNANTWPFAMFSLHIVRLSFLFVMKA